MTTASRRTAFTLLLACTLSGCGRETDDWLSDLAIDEPFTRTLAVAALREAPPDDHPRVVEALFRAALADTDAMVLEQTLSTLRELASRSPALFVKLLARSESLDYRRHLLGIILAVAEQSRPHLIEALKAPTPADRAILAVALGQAGGVSELMEWGSHGSPDVLAATIAGLDAAGAHKPVRELVGRLTQLLDGTPREGVVQAIVDASSHSLVAAREFATKLEGSSTGDAEILISAIVKGVLVGLRDHQAPAAVALLGELGDRAIPPLVDHAAEAEDRRVRYAAAVSLATLGTRVLNPLLERGVDDDLIVVVASALGEQGKKALRDAATSNNEAVRRAARRFAHR